MHNKIKIARAEKDITQDDLAQIIGVSRQTINSIEKNRYVPSTVLALKLSTYFNKSVNELFELEEGEWIQLNINLYWDQLFRINL